MGVTLITFNWPESGPGKRPKGSDEQRKRKIRGEMILDIKFVF